MKAGEKRILNIRKSAGYAVLAAVLLGSMILLGCKKEEKQDPAALSTLAASQSMTVAEEISSSAAESAAAAPEESASETEKTVLLDDDLIQLTLNGVFPFSPDPEDNSTTKTANPEVEISFDVTNRGDNEIVLDLRDLKIGEISVKRILLAGDVTVPGDTMTFRYGILPQEGEDPLTWDMASEMGVSGTVKVMNIEGEIAQAKFSAK